MGTLSISYFAAAFLVAYSYVLYPFALNLIAPRAGLYKQAPAMLGEDQLPRVTFLVAAHNEAADIQRRIENLLSLDYPPELVEILIASDGSSDDTYHIADRFSESQVHAVEHQPNLGKSATLNKYIPCAKGDVIIMSDANTLFASDVPRLLVRWLANPDIVAVSGKLILQDPQTGNSVDSAYWRYENRIKRLEGMLGAKLGANGAIYAFRKRDFAAFPGNTIVDDFVLPLLIKLRRGGHVVFDECACAMEETPEHISDEFNRRARIGTGAYQSLGLLWRLILPRQGWSAFCFVSHKVLRWLSPFLLVYMCIATLIGLGTPLFNVLLVLELAVGALAVIGLQLSSDSVISRVLRTITMFAAMNAALLLGFWRFLTQEQTGSWKRTSRAEGNNG